MSLTVKENYTSGPVYLTKRPSAIHAHSLPIKTSASTSPSTVSPKAVWRVKGQHIKKVNNSEQQKKVELYQKLTFSNKADWKKLKRPPRTASSKNKNSPYLFVDLSPKKVDSSTENSSGVSSAVVLPSSITCVQETPLRNVGTKNSLKSPCLVKFKNDIWNTTPVSSNNSSPVEACFPANDLPPKCVFQNGRVVLQPTYPNISNQAICSMMDDEMDCNDAKDAFAKIINRTCLKKNNSEPNVVTMPCLSSSTPSKFMNDENSVYSDTPLRHRMHSSQLEMSPTKGVSKPRPFKSKSYSGQSSAVLPSSFSSGSKQPFETPIKNINTHQPPPLIVNNKLSASADKSFTTVNIGSPIKLDYNDNDVNVSVDQLSTDFFFDNQQFAAPFPNITSVCLSNEPNGPNIGLTTPEPSPVVESFSSLVKNSSPFPGAFNSKGNSKPGLLNFGDDYLDYHMATIDKNLNSFQSQNSSNSESFFDISSMNFDDYQL